VTRQAAGLTLLGNDSTPPAGGGAVYAVGGSGARRFHLHTHSAGTYTLAIQLSQTLETGEAPVEIRIFQIVVK